MHSTMVSCINSRHMCFINKKTVNLLILMTFLKHATTLLSTSFKSSMAILIQNYDSNKIKTSLVLIKTWVIVNLSIKFFLNFFFFFIKKKIYIYRNKLNFIHHVSTIFLLRLKELFNGCGITKQLFITQRRSVLILRLTCL